MNETTQFEIVIYVIIWYIYNNTMFTDNKLLITINEN